MVLNLRLFSVHSRGPFAAQPAVAEMQKREFKVVGTWSFLDHWKEREGPFWKNAFKAVGRQAHGECQIPTELGLSGFEIITFAEARCV